MENKSFKKEYLNNVVITAENVKDFGEIIAITAMKKVMAYSGKSLDDLYAGLIHDVFDYKPIDEPYSDGYDIAMEAITFLCGYIGKRLNDEIMSKFDKPVTIKQACYRTLYTYLDKERCIIYHSKSLDNMSRAEEPSVETEQQTETDYTIYDTIIAQMGLTKGQIETLNCYMAGMGFVDIAEYLQVNLSTVWRRRKQMQQIYTQKVLNANY